MPESLFQRLRDDTTPSLESRDRIKASIQARIGHTPASSLLERIGGWLSPSAETTSLVRSHVLMRLQPIAVHSSYTRTKWVAAFAVFALAIRISPVLVLAPHTVAESDVLLIPTAGAIEISLKGLWQPVSDEITLKESVSMRANGGQATVLFHDDGTLRLDSDANVTIYDLSDRPEPALDGATLALHAGRIWVQGLLPTYVRPLTVTTPAGDVVMHNGSVSLALEDGQLLVQVWDHSATVHQGDHTVLLVTGEQARFRTDGSYSSISRLSDSAYENTWVTQNLQRDAVHQREVAQMQRERSAAKAGILPTSPLYSIKRAAERMDVLLTLDPDTKLQKQINLASTRLNEAVALVSEGSSTGATVQIEEYQKALQEIASGSGSNSALQFLLRQEIAENAAALNATQTTDAVYSVKKAVLEATADLSIDVVNDTDIQNIFLVDTLDALTQALAKEDFVAAQASYEAVIPYLPLLQSGALSTDARKEALSLLTRAADQLQDQHTDDEAQELSSALKPFLSEPTEPVVVIVPLSDEEVMAYATQILTNIDIFKLARPRLNQLRYEIKQIAAHPDNGRILRQLYHLLPGQDILSKEVRKAIQAIRK